MITPCYRANTNSYQGIVKGMPKILCYVHAYVGHGREAGAETTMANLLESLVAVGWQADVRICNPGVPEYTLNGVNVRSVNEDTELNKICKDYDVLISHLECSERAGLVGKHLRVPVVQLIHNTFWQTEGYLTCGTDLAVYNSVWVAAHHQGTVAPVVRVPKRGHIPEANSVTWGAPRYTSWRHIVVHPQIDPKLYRARGKHDSITMVNMFENKGPEVFYELAKRFPDQNFLAVVGGYGDQDIRTSLPNVEVVGNTADIKEIYRRTKILLMPSKYESFGRVAIEAAASGIPTVASPTDGLLEALGPEGIYCDDIDDWELELTILLGNDLAFKAAKKMARARSAYWDSVRGPETEKFVEAVNSLIIR